MTGRTLIIIFVIAAVCVNLADRKSWFRKSLCSALPMIGSVIGVIICIVLFFIFVAIYDSIKPLHAGGDQTIRIVAVFAYLVGLFAGPGISVAVTALIARRVLSGVSPGRVIGFTFLSVAVWFFASLFSTGFSFFETFGGGLADARTVSLFLAIFTGFRFGLWGAYSRLGEII